MCSPWRGALGTRAHPAGPLRRQSTTASHWLRRGPCKAADDEARLPRSDVGSASSWSSELEPHDPWRPSHDAPGISHLGDDRESEA